mgnify:CR=1 FL=1
MGRIIKHLKNNYKIIIAFILGVVISGGGVYAAVVITSKEITYEDNTSIGATNVQDAIDKLNTKATTKIKEAEAKCPDGYKCIKPLCKRSTTLHTETCSQTSTSAYCSGDGYTASGSMKTTTITYGNLGTTGILTSGDAFDCDVNGDGVYDSTTERFYYVSDMTNGVTQDSNTAVLIYYNNVSGGVASNSTAYAYDTNKDAYTNGPETAIKQLPTTSQWKNESLINATRNITDEKNTVRKSAFSYEGYAARLLTYQEVYNGCYDGTISLTSTKGLSSKCKYLMENTKYSSSSLKTYGGWLESPTASYSYAWSVDAYDRYVSYSRVDGTVSTSGFIGVRPAIEVLKSNISY